ncbi:hypothetical protein RTG_00831 [Rhodotorula toruloides ATCC 204091]|uniref:Uncharacterized protein n=1 Tax=Rhodotorula toruloides TaxID=5286 RepID=A0A0K3CHQ5_RHOTO|nr:hypothetical protein RTG_00831 [Rhodotorula toruloides ATCC 204091]PRQ74906.1 hypothetical protein AAT19DRAFT_13928 [Rhodotorula toruloides]
MAALNWTMLGAGRPVPLPSEKWLWTSSPNSIAASLFPHPPGSPLNVQPKKGEELRASRGTLYVSQKRVVYVAEGASSDRGGVDQAGPSSRAAEATGSLASGQASIAPGGLPQEAAKKVPLQSLSVPLRFFVDGRFVQPWFSATYYEALCMEGDKSGGLELPHLVRFYFKESGGYDFWTTVEEVKSRAELTTRRGGPPVEPLPLYSPPPSTSASSAVPNHPTQPSDPDLLAAQVAQDAEDAEEAQMEARCETGGDRPPPVPAPDEAPPAYQA